MAVEGSAAAALAAMREGLLPEGFERVVALLSGADIEASRIRDVVDARL